MKNHQPLIITLNDALDALIHQSALPPKAQADQLGIGYSRLVACTEDSAEWAYHHTRWVVPQTRMTGNFVLMDYLEQQLGRVGVFLPSLKAGAVPPATFENLPIFICRLMTEIGDVAKVSSEWTADRDLSAADRARIRKEVQDVIQRAVQIEVALTQGGA